MLVIAFAGAHRDADAASRMPQAAIELETIVPPSGVSSRQAAQESPPPSPHALPNGRAAATASRVAATFANILVNNPAGEVYGLGNTQMEPAVAAHGDTLLCGFTDSRGLWGTGTLSGFASSLDRGQTWTDGGSLPSPVAPMLTFGDPTVATDFQGRWYYLSELDRGNGTGGPGTGGLSVVLHRARFASGMLTWDPPFIVAGGANDRLDTAHMAVDPDRDRIYVAFTRVTPGTFQNGQIELVTLDQRGTHVVHQVIVQPQVTGLDHAGTRVALGPNGEVYCAFQGNVTGGDDGQGPGTQQISRSLDFGATFSTPVVAASVVESWLSGPPGTNREEESVEYPSIAVDRSSGPRRGRVYIAWHDALLCDFNGTLVNINETSAANGSPQEAQILAPPPPSNVGWWISGTLGGTDYADWYRFHGRAGDHMRMVVQPGSSMLSLRVVLRCLNGDGSGGADTTLAASTTRPGWQVYFRFTLPADGDYFFMLQRIGSVMGGYQAYLRRAASTLPSAAIDHRDIVVVSSPDGVGNWTGKVRVHDDTGFTDQAFPEVLVDGDGGVHVAWYDRRWDPHCRALADLALASSFDGGATFTPVVRVTTGFSWWQVAADAIPNFGDQFRPVVEDDRLHMVWADGRRGDPDVMFAPLATGFDLTLPDSVRVVPGQGFGIAGTVRNRTPHDGALFTVSVTTGAGTPQDTSWVVGPVPSGAEAAVVYDPIVNNVHGPVEVRFEVRCDRSAQIRSDVVVATNDAVPVWLQEFSALSGDVGVRLEWRGGAGARFDVQRAAAAPGPFTTLTPARVLADAHGRCVFHDANVMAGEVWFYRLMSTDAHGELQAFGPYRVETALPARLLLAGAVPNPFNPTTEIRFTLPHAAPVTLRIVDARGRHVATPLAGAPRRPGLHTVAWDGHDARGVPQASGVYWAELSALGQRVTARLVLVR